MNELKLSVTRTIHFTGHASRDHLLMRVGDDPIVEVKVKPQELIDALEVGAEFIRRCGPIACPSTGGNGE